MEFLPLLTPARIVNLEHDCRYPDHISQAYAPFSWTHNWTKSTFDWTHNLKNPELILTGLKVIAARPTGYYQHQDTTWLARRYPSILKCSRTSYICTVLSCLHTLSEYRFFRSMNPILVLNWRISFKKMSQRMARTSENTWYCVPSRECIEKWNSYTVIVTTHESFLCRRYCA